MACVSDDSCSSTTQVWRRLAIIEYKVNNNIVLTSPTAVQNEHSELLFRLLENKQKTTGGGECCFVPRTRGFDKDC
jgi:hypothetical protein